MEHSGSQLNILVLDSRRNNPFRFSARSAARGLAPMSAGRGPFIAFATAQGSVAGDNTTAQNGLFTQYSSSTGGFEGVADTSRFRSRPRDPVHLACYRL